MDDLGDVRLWDAAQERYVPAVTGRGVRMDVEKARGVVREMESLADQLTTIYTEIQPLTIVPAGSDKVSVNVAGQAVQMMIASREFLTSWHSDIRAGIDALTQQIAEYQAVDQQNSARA
jgi:hypothetical protein